MHNLREMADRFLFSKLMMPKIQMQRVFNRLRRLRIKTRHQYGLQFTSRYDPFQSANLTFKFETNHHEFPKTC